MVAVRFLSLASLEERAPRTREELRGSIKTDITPGGEESLGGGNSPRGYTAAIHRWLKISSSGLLAKFPGDFFPARGTRRDRWRSLAL